FADFPDFVSENGGGFADSDRLHAEPGVGDPEVDRGRAPVDPAGTGDRAEGGRFVVAELNHDVADVGFGSRPDRARAGGVEAERDRFLGVVVLVAGDFVFGFVGDQRQLAAGVAVDAVLARPRLWFGFFVPDTA